jgi:hypothetical protein
MKILTVLKTSWIDISDFTVIKFAYQEVGHRVQVSRAALAQFVLHTLIVYRFFVLEKSYEQ